MITKKTILGTFFKVLGFLDFVISRSRTFFAWAAASSIAADWDTAYTMHDSTFSCTVSLYVCMYVPCAHDTSGNESFAAVGTWV